MGQIRMKLGDLWFVEVLTLIFVIGKVWGKIDWAWMWVFAPLWMTAGAALAILLIWGIIYFIWSMLK